MSLFFLNYITRISTFIITLFNNILKNIKILNNNNNDILKYKVDFNENSNKIIKFS